MRLVIYFFARPAECPGDTTGARFFSKVHQPEADEAQHLIRHGENLNCPTTIASNETVASLNEL